MDIKIDTSTQPPRLTLVGEMTIYAAAGLKEDLLATLEQHDGMEIDLSQVAEIDTAGLQLLILAKRLAMATGKSMSLVRHSQEVVALLELYNVTAFFGDPMLIPAGESPAGAKA